MKNDDWVRLDFSEHAFPMGKAMLLLMLNSREPLFVLEKQRVCSFGFRRPCFSNWKSNDSVNAEIAKAIFSLEKQRLCSSGFLSIWFSNEKNNDSVNTKFTEPIFLIRKATIALVRESPPVCRLMPQFCLGG